MRKVRFRLMMIISGAAEHTEGQLLDLQSKLEKKDAQIPLSKRL